ncbi:MAG TPA: hypothetical protein VK465_01480, partial [Fibrobacteria bacterium]|nr:hypothetical protein [Fibrobacteria bacterium]
MRVMQRLERNRLVTIQNANSPAASTVTVEQHPAWLTQEMWDGLSKKTIGLDTLKPEQQEEFSSFLAKVTTGEASAPAAPAAPAPAATQASTATP